MATKRILLDTNILIDAFDKERPGHDAAVDLLVLSDERDDVEFIASLSSFKDMCYILTRLYKSADRAFEAVEGLMGVAVRPVDLLAAYGREALISDEPDFEDALIRVTAEREAAYAIVSHDETAFVHSTVPRKTAAEALALLRR